MEHRDQQVWPLLLHKPTQASWSPSQLEQGLLGATHLGVFCVGPFTRSPRSPDQVAQSLNVFLRGGVEESAGNEFGNQRLRYSAGSWREVGG